MTRVILGDLRLSAWQASVSPCVSREKEGSRGTWRQGWAQSRDVWCIDPSQDARGAEVMGHSGPQMVNYNARSMARTPNAPPRSAPFPEGGPRSKGVRPPWTRARLPRGRGPLRPCGGWAATWSLCLPLPPGPGPCAVRQPAADPCRATRGSAWPPPPTDQSSSPSPRADGSASQHVEHEMRSAASRTSCSGLREDRMPARDLEPRRGHCSGQGSVCDDRWGHRSARAGDGA